MPSAADALIRLAPCLDGLSVSLLDLDAIGNADEAAGEWLAPRELDEFARLRHPARRREWLGARVCAKAMWMNRSPAGDPRARAVVKDARGVPWLVAEGALDWLACSLAHDSRFAAAGLAWRGGMAVGVDVESISRRVLRLAPAFVREDEWLPARRRSPSQAARLWALKEAAAKAAGGGLGLALRATVRQAAAGPHAVTWDGTPTLAGWHAVHDGHVVAACVATD